MSHIVLIDDDKYILESLKEILSLENHTVFATENGWEALDYIDHNAIDLIISDVEMPEIKGYEILEKIKSDISNAVIPFIFLSGLDNEHHIRHGMSLGADDYITKPFEASTILEAVKSRIEKNQKIEKVIKSKLEALSSSITSALPHELLTPLNGIIAPLQMLMSDFDSYTKEEIQELHKVIYYCSIRLKSLASNFIYISELSKRQIEDNNQQYELKNTEAIIQQLAQSIAKDKNREQDLEIDIQNHFLNINDKDFRKLFEELLSNAIKFSTFGSTIQISSKVEGDKVIYNIIDHGKGMSKDQINQVDLLKQFDRKEFEQQGLGLGLYICKKIGDLNQVDFNIESEIGKYTKVELSFQKA